jgi:hypothetical protein
MLMMDYTSYAPLHPHQTPSPQQPPYSLRYNPMTEPFNVKLASFDNGGLKSPFSKSPLEPEGYDADTASSMSNNNRFAGAKLEDYKGKLYELCKDQNGCRFLQKKLEEPSANVTIIYEEIHTHFVELMTGMYQGVMHILVYYF